MPKEEPAKKSTTVVDGVELKGCPFCGYLAKLKTDVSGFVINEKGQRIDGTRYYWAKCSNFDCSVSTKSSNSQDIAVGLWNTRA